MKTIERTDIRVKIMNEILLGIQVIKMYAWEKSFAKMVDQVRKWVDASKLHHLSLILYRITD